MPRLILTEGAAIGLDRCRAFLAEKNPHAAVRAGKAISARLLALELTPEIGRPFDREPALRELTISFGASGYIALHRYDLEVDCVFVLAFRHQRGAGYE